MNPSISIIIPVYNVEAYLEACLSSVLAQTRQPDEVILVDDGSTDTSGALCDSFASRCERIRVIHKTNGGLSDARNAGIRAAKSDYLLFLDSDDTIAADTIEKFLPHLCNHPDAVVGNILTLFPHKTVLEMHSVTDGKPTSGSAFLKKELVAGTMYYESYQCLYSRLFLVSKDLWFVKGLLHEDQVFTTVFFLKAEKIIPTDVVFYNHMIREGSITTQKDQTPNARSVVRICHILEKEAETIQDRQLRRLVLDHCVSLYYRAYIDAKLIDHPQIRMDIPFLKRNSYSQKNKARTLLYSMSQRIFYEAEKARRGK